VADDHHLLPGTENDGVPGTSAVVAYSVEKHVFVIFALN
jgi:hypothetical protein